MRFTGNATIQPSLPDIILLANFLLKFANSSPSRIKPGRTHWHPERETLLWSPTQQLHCRTLKRNEKLTRFDCLFFIWAAFKQMSLNDSSCLLTPFCQNPEGATGAETTAASRGVQEDWVWGQPAQGSAEQGREPATGCRDWLQQLLPSFASSRW